MTTETNKAAEDSSQEIFSRIGQLTRLLRDGLTNLGLERAIIEAAEAIPDARDRLSYVVGKTSQAADRVLTCVEVARPLQDELNDTAAALESRWNGWFENPIELSDAQALVVDTRKFFDITRHHSAQTNEQLMEIMMAQDFQDLTGQVIQRMMKLIEHIEKELVQVLLENVPDPTMREAVPSLLNGPQIDQSKAGIVATQDQVDDLLDSLGF